jgi:hypothetical protein
MYPRIVEFGVFFAQLVNILEALLQVGGLGDENVIPLSFFVIYHACVIAAFFEVFKVIV